MVGQPYLTELGKSSPSSARQPLESATEEVFQPIGAPSETWRPLARHAEAAFESDPDPPQRPFVEKLADQGDAVGHATRRRKLLRRMVGIGRPVAARLRHFDEARTQCK